MIPGGSRGPSGGAEGEIRGLGSRGDGGEKPRVAGLGGNYGQRVLVESWAERRGCWL